MPAIDGVEAGPITPEVRSFIEGAIHSSAAAITPEGQPDLSPVSRVRVWDDWHVYFTDAAGSRTREYAESNPWVSLNVVDGSGRGYRILGDVTVHDRGDIHALAAGALQPDPAVERAGIPILLLRVERLEALDPQAEATVVQLQS